MRILMVAPQPFFRPRGTPFSVLHRIRGLLRLGHTVELVTYPFGESPELDGLVIHRAPRPPGVRDVGIGPSVAKLLLDGPLFARALQLARTGAFDLLHTHEEAGVLGARLARQLRISHLYDMHSSLPQQFANFGRFNWRPVVAMFRQLERYTLGGADGVIAICPNLREHIRAIGYEGPVAVIENTLDFEAPPVTEAELTGLRGELELGSGPVVLYTGTFEAYQGLDLLIAAAPTVGAAIPSVRFVLVGGAPSQIEALARDAGTRGVRSSFRFVPTVAPRDVFRYHRLADVLITTRSRGTNTPLKIYQYLRAGRAILATAIRSHTQVLNQQVAELVPCNPEDIAQGLIRVLRDPQRRRSLAENAARLAQAEYSEERYLTKLGDLLTQLPRAAARAVT